MKRPAWSLELVRDTNAPLELVQASLKKTDFRDWHPRLAGVCPELETTEDGSFRMNYHQNPCWGVLEMGQLEVQRKGDRTLLIHRARFKGWPVLLLMGWWRLHSHRMWERFVETL